jgi:hypothetical protein
MCVCRMSFTVHIYYSYGGKTQRGGPDWILRNKSKIFLFRRPSISNRHRRCVVVVMCTPLIDEVFVTLSLLNEVGACAVCRKKIQFLPYGRSIGSWTCLTHKTYIRIQHQWRLAILIQFSVLIEAVCHILPSFVSYQRCVVHRWVFGVPWYTSLLEQKHAIQFSNE